MAALDRALAHLASVVYANDAPAVATYRTARYEAHRADSICMDVLGGATRPSLKEHLTRAQWLTAAAMWRI